ncbi:MAG: hypothetical protein GC158_06745 [Cyanobacteria bacterium RI_101]|nr:hypothetical protein [Cyanobacteria bacterium RI_101]
MNKSLTLELSEQIFELIQRQAISIGISPAQLAAILLEQKFAPIFPSPLVKGEINTEKPNFARHFGTLELSDSTNLENESIDIDLAREHCNNHE